MMPDRISEPDPKRSDRFSSGEHRFYPAGESPPSVASDLLKQLGVEGETKKRQRAAITAWRADNVASPLLLASLRMHELTE